MAELVDIALGPNSLAPWDAVIKIRQFARGLRFSAGVRTWRTPYRVRRRQDDPLRRGVWWQAEAFLFGLPVDFGDVDQVSVGHWISFSALSAISIRRPI